jgi:hypothetical protein
MGDPRTEGVSSEVSERIADVARRAQDGGQMMMTTQSMTIEKGMYTHAPRHTACRRRGWEHQALRHFPPPAGAAFAASAAFCGDA